jgi:DNA-directed RNA polymerase subunit RPC12/RpoP
VHVTVYRCCSCHRIVTDVELEKYGKCPFCSETRVTGANPNKFEIFKLFFRLLFFNPKEGDKDGGN